MLSTFLIATALVAFYIVALVWAVASHVGYNRALRDVRVDMHDYLDRGQESAHRASSPESQGRDDRVTPDGARSRANGRTSSGIDALNDNLRRLRADR